MKMEEMIERPPGMAAGYGCTAELDYKYLCPAVINSDERSWRRRGAAVKLFGEDARPL
ncbi:MAG: hypothetical protein ACLUEQ_05505 [Cloacibacillus evryensis]